MKFNIFNRKKDISPKEYSDTDLKNVDKAIYKVHAMVDDGGAPRRIKSILAYRWRDPADDVVYLRNDKADLMEIMPQNKDVVINFTEAECDKKIKELKTILKSEDIYKNPKINHLNIIYELKLWEAKKRYFLYEHKSSYVVIGENNIPEYYFKRQGSNFLPMKWDMDSSAIFVPSDARKKSVQIERDNKEIKYKANLKFWSSPIFWIYLIGILLMITGSIFAYKMYMGYEESELASLQRGYVEFTKECSEQQLKQISQITDITEKMKQEALGQRSPEEIIGSGLNPFAD